MYINHIYKINYGKNFYNPDIVIQEAYSDFEQFLS